MKAKIFCLALSLGLVLAGAEIFTRLTWKEYVRGLHQVLPDKMHLKANSEGHYKSSEFEFTVTANSFGKRDREWTKETLADPDRKSTRLNSSH